MMWNPFLMVLDSDRVCLLNPWPCWRGVMNGREWGVTWLGPRTLWADRADYTWPSVMTLWNILSWGPKSLLRPQTDQASADTGTPTVCNYYGKTTPFHTSDYKSGLFCTRRVVEWRGCYVWAVRVRLGGPILVHVVLLSVSPPIPPIHPPPPSSTGRGPSLYRIRTRRAYCRVRKHVITTDRINIHYCSIYQVYMHLH